MWSCCTLPVSGPSSWVAMTCTEVNLVNLKSASDLRIATSSTTTRFGPISIANQDVLLRIGTKSSFRPAVRP